MAAVDSWDHPVECVMFPCNYIILVTWGQNNLNTTWNICWLLTVTANCLPVRSALITILSPLLLGTDRYHMTCNTSYHGIITIITSNSWWTSHNIKCDNLYISQPFGELSPHHGLSRPGTEIIIPILSKNKRNLVSLTTAMRRSDIYFKKQIIDK